MAEIGTVLGGKYKLLKRLGRGGMSVVYLAMDIRLNKRWAVKEIRKDNTWDTGALWKGLQMEANILKIVDHPVLPRIVDIVHFEGTVFVVMDYVEGMSMSEVLRSEGAQPQHQVIEWAKELCSALDYLHSLTPPIIYRDMKPSNIILKPDGRIKLIDFGTAKEFDASDLADKVALGTRGYAAPEQFGDAKGRGLHKTDARTDIYNLGATLYHLLTGKAPSEPPYVIKPIRSFNPALSGGLEKIIQKCTMPNPKDRYSNCAELLYDLEHYEELDGAFRKMCFRKMRSFLASVFCALCFAAAAIGVYIGNRQEIRKNYEGLIREGYLDIVQGKYEDAVNVYVDAITEVDGSRNTAYLELMNLYINYMDDARTGLNRVTYYIDQRYRNIDKDQTLLMNVALNYFDVLQDYSSSAYYFNLLDKKRYPETTYYGTIALAMGELNIDYNSLLDDLKQFELINDNTTMPIHKLMNYRLLCIVYARNLNQIETAAASLVRVADKGLQTLEKYGEDNVKAEYYTIYNQYLSQGYECMGNMLAEKNREEAEKYYKKALESCDFILGMVSMGDEHTIGSITDNRLREAKYCQKAEIYEALGQYDAACEVYEKAEKEYGKTSISIYTGYLTLLCKIQEQKTTDVELWDYDSLHTLYMEGNAVPDIKNDYRWKQLSQKLSPLFEKNGGM